MEFLVEQLFYMQYKTLVCGTTHYHAQLRFPAKDPAIKRFVVCNSLDLEPSDLLNGLALGCYQPSPEV